MKSAPIKIILVAVFFWGAHLFYKQIKVDQGLRPDKKLVVKAQTSADRTASNKSLTRIPSSSKAVSEKNRTDVEKKSSESTLNQMHSLAQSKLNELVENGSINLKREQLELVPMGLLSGRIVNFQVVVKTDTARVQLYQQYIRVGVDSSGEVKVVAYEVSPVDWTPSVSLRDSANNYNKALMVLAQETADESWLDKKPSENGPMLVLISNPKKPGPEKLVWRFEVKDRQHPERVSEVWIDHASYQIVSRKPLEILN